MHRIWCDGLRWISGGPMQEFLNVAREAALRAGRLLRENLNGTREISYKGEINLVTEMDRRSERAAVETLLAAFPGHGIMAEEEARIENGSGFVWIIDPLDGTTNYAHGYPNFAVSIGLERSGEITLGVVYDPMRDELFSAVKGGGAYLNDKLIHVSHADTLIRSGSASLDLCSVAAGRLDGYWELKLQPWDVAAGSLIVHEAGGMVSDFSGVRFSVYDKEILASNGIIHKQIREVLKGAGGERGEG